MERPKLPTQSVDATKTEVLTPLVGKKSGELLLIDKGEYQEQIDLLTQAIGAVNRLNDRQGARNSYDRCVKAIFETGKTPSDCPTN